MAAHDIPDTPAIRATMQKTQEESLAKLGLDPQVVAGWEDGWRTAEDVDEAFEWWYFDMQLDDGTTLVATFNTKPHSHPDGPLDPSVLLIYQGPDGRKVRINEPYSSADFTASTKGCDVRIGPNTVEGDLASYTLHVEVAGIVADLQMTRRAPSWRPGAGVSWFDSRKKHYMAWVVPVPYGTVTGTITDHLGQREVTGTGYHDHNWGNRLMSSYLDHWYWGRAHVGDFTVVYVRMTTKGLFGFGSLNIPTIFLAKGERLLTDDLLPLRLVTSGETAGPGGQSYPTDLLWTWQTDEGSLRMHITNPTMIESLDLKEDSSNPVKTLLHAHSHPMYFDFNADLELTVDLPGVRETVKGRTLFEKMMFR